MNLRQLEVFWAIMRTGSITAAAKLLSVSQPAISKTLRHTEDRTGLTLFLRKSGKLVPTEEAEHLFETVETLFDNVENVRRALIDLRDGLSGRLQIAVVPSMAQSMQAPINAFLAERPEVDLTLKVLSTSQVLARVARQQVDLGLVYGPIINTDLHLITLGDLPVMCFMRRDHPLAQNSRISPADLAETKVISFSETSVWGKEIARSAVRKYTPWHVSVECNHSGVALALAEQGVGIAVTVPPLDGVISPALISLPFHPQVTLEPFCVCRQYPSPRLIDAMIAHLLGFAGAQKSS